MKYRILWICSVLLVLVQLAGAMDFGRESGVDMHGKVIPRIDTRVYNMPPPYYLGSAFAKVRLHDGQACITLQMGHFGPTLNWHHPFLRIFAKLLCGGSGPGIIIPIGTAVDGSAVSSLTVQESDQGVVWTIKWKDADQPTHPWRTTPHTITMPWAGTKTLRVAADLPIPNVGWLSTHTVWAPPGWVSLTKWHWIGPEDAGYTWTTGSPSEWVIRDE